MTPDIAAYFKDVPANDPAKAGQLAYKKLVIDGLKRHVIAPVHTQSDAVEWCVWDAGHPNSKKGWMKIIRQAETLAEAIEGLV